MFQVLLSTEVGVHGLEVLLGVAMVCAGRVVDLLGDGRDPNRVKAYGLDLIMPCQVPPQKPWKPSRHDTLVEPLARANLSVSNWYMDRLRHSSEVAADARPQRLANPQTILDHLDSRYMSYEARRRRRNKEMIQDEVKRMYFFQNTLKGADASHKGLDFGKYTADQPLKKSEA